MFPPLPENLTHFLFNPPLDDIYILEYGYNDFNKIPSNLATRYQHNYSIHLVLEGEGVLNYGGQQYLLKQNDIFYLPPCDSFSYYANPKSPWRYVWFLFNGKKAKKIMDLTELSEQRPVISIKNKQYEKCSKIFYSLLFNSKKNNDNSLKALSAFFSFISKLKSNNLKNEELELKTSKDKYNAIVHILQLNFNNPNLTIDRILSSLCLSHSYACKLFKKFSPDKTIQEHLIQIRMDNASFLLKTTNYPIKEITVSVGYLDQLIFSRQFKKHFGCSPTQYRESNLLSQKNVLDKDK